MKNQATSQTMGNLRERLSDWRRQHLDKEIGALSVNMKGREGYPSSFAGQSGGSRTEKGLAIQTNTPSRKPAAH